MADAILTLNAGSSSLKLGLFNVGDAGQLALAIRAEVDELAAMPHFSAWDAGGVLIEQQHWPEAANNFRILAEQAVGWAARHPNGRGLLAVGHRIVHGGSDYIAPRLLTGELVEALDRLSPLAPLHLPQNLVPIRAIAAAYPHLAQVACFDTAFHHTMPPVATRFALPRNYEREGVRRYGFHGLSYQYIADRLREVSPRLADGKTIVAHLGNGASLCALRAGVSVDTTMGFSVLDGLVMGTRPGTLDPGVVLYLQRHHGMSESEVEDLLYLRSGLLGVSGGIGSDMRTLLASPEPAAREAVELFVYRLAREAGGLVSSLGGLDGVVFTGGIGEHSAPIRAAIAERLVWLGLRIDAEANARGEMLLSAAESTVEVRIIPTDEEKVIAGHTLEVVTGGYRDVSSKPLQE
ncbi:MAG: acetate/propionate family kinase [Rhizobiales bacterium]|nr:acetate/propionate family kinase [Hyphomicrobiales bacterium]